MKLLRQEKIQLQRQHQRSISCLRPRDQFGCPYVHIPGWTVSVAFPFQLQPSWDSTVPSGEWFISDGNHSVSMFHTSAQQSQRRGSFDASPKVRMQLQHGESAGLTARKPWGWIMASYNPCNTGQVNSLGLSFLTCKMGVIIIFLSES